MERRRTAAAGFLVHSVHAGSGAPVVLLHGLSGSHRWWLKTVPALAPHFRVHVPELVGFGDSRLRPRSTALGLGLGPGRARRLYLPDIPEMAQVVRAWLQTQGLERVHLVGHSMGGQVSIHLAASHPELIDSLVLVSASGIPRPLEVREATRFVTELASPRAWTSTRFARTIVLDAVRAGPRALARAVRHILLDDVRALLPRIPHRTLLLWGARDALTPLPQGQEMASAIPDSRLVVLGGAGHIPMVEAPAEFNAALLRFLAAP